MPIFILFESVGVSFEGAFFLLFTEQKSEMKRGENALFDVTMGLHYGVEVCDLVGSYLLGKLLNIIDKKNISLYRDDGLSVIEKENGPKPDLLREDVIAMRD